MCVVRHKAIVVTSLIVTSLVVPLAVMQAQRPAPAVPASSADARFDQVAAAVEARMRELGVPGAALGILADGQIRTRAFGVTNADHPLPVTADTLFQIGSISKTFTGTAIMRLVDQRKLRLDDPVRKYIPGFKVSDQSASARVAVRDTLTHMGGWEGDFFDDPSSGDDALQRIVARMATLEQTAKVGEMWGYNNAGFYVAGRIVEVVTGKPFEAALRELVLDPLGLDSAYFFPADVMTRRFVVGHGGSNGATVIGPWPIPRAANAAGGITTNVDAMLRYAAFHMGDGTGASGARVLPMAALQQMRSAIVPKAGTDQAMGLTWHLSEAGGLAIAEHGGGTNGQISLLRLVPAHGFAMAIVTNATRGGSLTTHVARAAMSAYFGIPASLPSRISVDAAALQEYVGTYRRPFADIRVAVEDGALTFHSVIRMPGLDGKIPPPPPPRRLGFHARDRLLNLDGPTAGEAGGEFIRSADGRVAWLRVSRIHKRLPAQPTTR
jgi:CubicO group peptidase (beta-lactamase class C family)